MNKHDFLDLKGNLIFLDLCREREIKVNTISKTNTLCLYVWKKHVKLLMLYRFQVIIIFSCFVWITVFRLQRGSKWEKKKVKFVCIKISNWSKLIKELLAKTRKQPPLEAGTKSQAVEMHGETKSKIIETLPKRDRDLADLTLRPSSSSHLQSVTHTERQELPYPIISKNLCDYFGDLLQLYHLNTRDPFRIQTDRFLSFLRNSQWF